MSKEAPKHTGHANRAAYLPGPPGLQDADMGYLPCTHNVQNNRSLRPALALHLGGGDDNVLVVLVGQDDGANIGYLLYMQSSDPLRIESAMAPHLGGGDDDVLVVLAGQDDGALRLQVEVLLAAHAHAALHHVRARLPGRAHVAAHNVVPRALHAAARLRANAQERKNSLHIGYNNQLVPM